MNKGILQDFLALYPSTSTRNTYSWVFGKFMRNVFGEGDLGTQTDEYFSRFTTLNQHKRNIEAFFASIDDSAPKSQGTSEGALRALFNYIADYSELNRIPDRFWRDLRRRRKGLRG